MKPVIIKRDGCRAPFNATRIAEAVDAARRACAHADAGLGNALARTIGDELAGREEVDIHEIQTRVEDLLMAQAPEVARAYIEYRHDRDLAREARGRLAQDIAGLVEQSNTALLNENANKDAKVIPTQRDLLAGIVARHYALTHLLHQQRRLCPSRRNCHG